MRLVIVGGVAAGTKAASRARRVDPEMEISIYQEEPDISIGECGLPYHLSGLVKERQSLVARTPQKFAEKGIDVHTRHRVESIDLQQKSLRVRDLSTGEEREEGYDRLILATGARALRPPLSGLDLGGVFNLRFLTDADAIREHITRRTPRCAVVAGAGYIGLEVAENLRALGMEVKLVEMEARVAPACDPELCEVIEDHLTDNGIEVLTSTKVERINGRDGLVCSVATTAGELEADLVVLGLGIGPRVELAKDAGVTLGSTGAIRVDSRLRTNVPGIWAAGDCAQTVHLVSGEEAWAPLGDTANQMGRVAGTNAAGGSAEFPGVLGTSIFKVFDLGVAKTGLSEQDARRAGLNAVCATVDSSTTAGYYPGGERVSVKLVAEQGSGRLLGAQALGGAADRLIDVCATALWGKLGVEDLINLDLAYAPPFGPTLSPVIQAASVLEGKLRL